nr:hypothetical protein [Reichenbachiella versicolor]
MYTSKISTLIVVVLLSASFAFAGTKEKAVLKAIETVENGSPDDWKLLAAQAQYLISKNAGYSQAKDWIDKSISIKEDAYNFEVLGDYYLKSNLPSKAMESYVKSIQLTQQQKDGGDISRVQFKLSKLYPSS